MIRRGWLRGLSATLILASSAALAQPQSMHLWTGTWKRNLAKSSYSPGPPPQADQFVTLAIVNGFLQVTESGSDAAGQPTRHVYTLNFDGTEQTVDAAQGLTRTYRWVDERQFEAINRVRRDETTMMEYALGEDGKSYTVTTTGITAQGQLVHHIVVYEKQ
jgi:hypothetical protein